MQGLNSAIALTPSTLATLGLSQLDIMQQGHNLGKVLAQNTGRKLALLVGINQYPQSSGLKPLSGCVTDVRLQQELLIHRFGFKAEDVITLTNQQATREGILTKFEQHLINQARPGDVVVFHFSGHGSRLYDRDGDAPDGLNSALVPVDGRLPEGYPFQGGIVNHVMGHTLFLLMSALKAENVTVVLDCCHSGGGKRGNLRVRAVDDGELLKPSLEELLYQGQWLDKLGMSRQEFIQKLRQTVAKGVVIASARREQLAADLPFGDFHAGAFTYLLTQYIWQQIGNEPINRAIANVGRSTKILASREGYYQDPEIESNLNPQNTNPPLYFFPFQAIPAEAVITQVNNNQAQLWLGGIDSQSLEAFTNNPLFSVVDAQGNEVGWLKLDSRQGLEGKGTLVNTRNRSIKNLQPGTLLQERIRSIPNNPTLKIGIDESLDQKTSQQAIQAMQAIKRIETTALGKQEVQYIFGQMTGTKIAFKIQNNESQPLYMSILVIDAEGTMTVIFPNNWSASENAALVEANQTQLIPQIDDEFVLTVAEPLGVSEALIIASTSPLRTSLQALQKIASLAGVSNTRQPVSTTPDQILDVTNKLLDDLDTGTRNALRGQEVTLPSGVWGIDTQKLAAMAIAFEVVPS
ncbi:peptidase C14, caspase catalytic subunit p20 [Nostoc sp. ATCC 43529]|nr:peptidase C14, caspase catalytic subunit p20 [Nostoc sp. ATCC 43529]